MARATVLNISDFVASPSPWRDASLIHRLLIRTPSCGVERVFAEALDSRFAGDLEDMGTRAIKGFGRPIAVSNVTGLSS
jgi:hypothetical protein